MKFSKRRKRQAIDMSAGAGLVVLGLAIGAAVRKTINKFRGSSAPLFTGDPVIDAAKKL